MGFREKVTIVFSIVLFLQITARICMPKNINTLPLRSPKRLKKILQTPTANNILEQYYKKSNILDTNKGNIKTDRESNKFSKNVLNELIKSIKSKHGNPAETNMETQNSLLKPFATTPQPYCFKEVGTFPEVEYPMFVTDTWTPNYWKKLPEIQQNLKTNGDSYVTSKTDTEKTKYIKPSNKAIEKAVKALIKYREKTDNLNADPVNNTKTEPDANTCPVDPPDQCLPSDEPKIKNTTIPTTKLSPSEYFDPHPVYGTYTSADHDMPSVDQPITTLEDPKDINRLHSPTELISEYVQESYPNSAVPLLPASSSISNTASSSSSDNGFLNPTSLLDPTTSFIEPDQSISPIADDTSTDKLVDTPFAGFIEPTELLSTSSGDINQPPVSSESPSGQIADLPNNNINSEQIMSNTATGALTPVTAMDQSILPPATDVNNSIGTPLLESDITNPSNLVPTSSNGNLNPTGPVNLPTTDIINTSQSSAPMTSDNNVPNSLVDELPTNVIDSDKTQDTQAIGAPIGVGSLPVGIVDISESTGNPKNEIISQNVPGIPEDTIIPFETLKAPAESVIDPTGALDTPHADIVNTDSILASPEARTVDPTESLQASTYKITNPTESVISQTTGVDSSASSFKESDSDTGISNLQPAEIVKSAGSISSRDSIVDPKDLPGTPTDFLRPTGTLATTMVVGSILVANGINPAGTFMPSATGINDPTELLYAPDNEIDSLTKETEEPVGSLAGLPSSTGDLNDLQAASFTGITDTSAPVTKIDNTEIFNSFIPSQDPISLLTTPISSESSSKSSLLSSADTMSSILTSSSTSYSESNSDLGTNDYEFATMPPFLISYDTSENMPDPDDSSTKFSPGDVDYILV